MTIRTERMRTIVNLLNAQVITGQEQLMHVMQQHGYNVTQATLSRDLRDLRAEKRYCLTGHSNM